MSADNGDRDLGLSLGCSSNCIRTKLKENSGAGVNAASIIDMTYTASNSLSELIWSPHSGLSLKCAERSLADKKPFLLWNVGPSNTIPSLSQGISCNGTDDETKMEENFIISEAAFHVDSEIVQRASLSQSPGSTARPIIGSSHVQNMESRDEMDEEKIEKGILVKERGENAGYLDENDKESCDPCNERIDIMAERSQENTGPIGSNINMARTEALSGDLNLGISNDFNPIVSKAVNGGQFLEEVTTSAEVHRETVSEAQITPPQISTYFDEPNKEVKGAFEEERKNKSKIHGSMVPILQKLEHTAENDLQHPMTKDAYQQNEERLLRGCSLPLETSPGDGSRQPCPLKGKEKALSDSNIGGRFSNNLDDSQESVESCTSTGLLGKRRWKFDQQLICESKRVKQQTDGCPESTSLIKHDSSFMNWISNMVNGFSKSNHEEVPSLGLTHAHFSREQTDILHETMICREHQESVSKNMGFQTIFRSLYRSGEKLIETQVSRDDSSVERLQNLVQVDKINVQRSSINSSVQNGVSLGHIFIADEKILPSSTECVVSQSDQAWNLSAIPIKNEFSTDSADDKAPSNQEFCRGNTGISSSNSLGHHKMTAAENANTRVASDGRETCDLSNKNNLLGSLWITRFSTKTSGIPSNLNHSKRDNCLVIDGLGDCERPNTQNQTSLSFPIEEKHSDTMVNENSGDLVKNLETFAASAEFSLGFMEIHERKHSNSVLKLQSTLPSQGPKSSEAMASTFARRVDALKHIIPSEAKKDANFTAPTCFYCGKSGHNLQDCSEVMESELEDLLKNMSSCNWLEDSPYLCIRCFQIDHWAITCPVVTSNRQHQLENKMSFVKCQNVSKPILFSGNQRKACFLDKGGHLKVGLCSGEEPSMNTGLRNLVSNPEEFSGNNLSSDETLKQITSNSGKKKLIEHQNLPLSNLVSEQIEEVPKVIFDAVRRLQLSRADILKWMSSDVSLSHLEGLFLRLRLGKWEAGLGGTGYYVACITGEPAKDSKTSISVSVGGIKCSVGSQYVSNHDFLEDELKVWWSRTLRNGGKIPSTEDLETKLRQRIKLGF
ncbi:uncharacterized protein LOC113764842 [Coffea eugenioides]|uniref:uncharacterized protein LOC113764842 n=1 Tax=Coffea eugenioides TaxID=49369 RepID=UPI000F613717|nr:uncharacterized protein LOC113764842 [Coffea eugenioides]XP_027164660.1 uncharacterized protein LOC113764842 [Coffea eugenioides]XP_027164661.1 uncharacterized protein LOC113764842 [Coffea eugenioides]